MGTRLAEVEKHQSDNAVHYCELHYFIWYIYNTLNPLITKLCSLINKSV